MRHLIARHRALIAEMLRFGIVGTSGYVIGTVLVYLMTPPLGKYAAGAVSFLIAASVNWAIHRAWTFRGRGGDTALHRQWLTFLAANSLGFALNFATYAALRTWSPLCDAHPFLATAGGTAAGMGVNFVMSRQVVFRAATP